MLLGQTAVSRQYGNGLEENMGDACKLPKPEGDKKLKKAIGNLSSWIETLRGMEEVRPKPPSWNAVILG